MRKLTISSARGGSIDLFNNEYFLLSNLEGQTENMNDISVTTTAGYDGGIVNSAQAQSRTMSLELLVKSGVNVELAKRHISQVIKPYETVTFTLEQENRTTIIQGTVERISMPRYQNGIAFIADFLCTQPFWEDAKELYSILSDVTERHIFTAEEDELLCFPEEGIVFGEFNYERQKDVYNYGDVPIGMTIEIIAVNDVTNPIIYGENGTYIGVNTTMIANDKIVISTHKRKKTIYKNDVNILDTIMPGSTWLQLNTGINTFNFNSDDNATDNCYFRILYKQRYV
jgi:hypothetical protein